MNRVRALRLAGRGEALAARGQMTAVAIIAAVTIATAVDPETAQPRNQKHQTTAAFALP